MKIEPVLLRPGRAASHLALQAPRDGTSNELDSKTGQLPSAVTKKRLTASWRLGARKALRRHAPGGKPVQRVTSRLDGGALPIKSTSPGE
jgi:hypothetical protein